MLHGFMLNICVPPHSLPSDKIFLGPITGFKASGAVWQWSSKTKSQQKGKLKLRGHETDIELSYLLKLCQGGKHKAVNDDNDIATQKVGFYPISGRSIML